MRNIRNIFSISLSLVGSMVGVGLASGREVVSFFARYGLFSIFFCFISSFVIFCLIYASMSVCHKNNHENKKCKNKETNAKLCFKVRVCGSNFKNVKIFDVVIFLCQISICSVMFAGLFSMFSEFSNLFVVRVLLLLFVFTVSFLILKSGNSLMFSFNFFLSILLVVFCLFLLIVFVISREVDFLVGCNFSEFGFVGSLLYAGMNVLTIFPLIKETSSVLKNKKEILILSFLVSLFVFMILMIILSLVLFFGGDRIGDDMIMLSLSGRVSDILFFVHFCLIMFSVFTTLLSTASGACSFLKKFDRKVSVLFVLLICSSLSFVGFSNLVDFLYPILGLIFIVFIVFFVASDWNKNIFLLKKKRKNNINVYEKRF